MSYVFVFALTYIGMEFMAWFTHKYVMHGFLWSWHKDHHQKNPHKILEKNDRFFIVYALVSMAMITAWKFGLFNYGGSVGFGIFAYGLSYFLVHDVFIHQRIRWFRKTNHFYARAIRKAHKVHHKHLGKQKGECFGLLWVPLKYYKRL